MIKNPRILPPFLLTDTLHLVIFRQYSVRLTMPPSCRLVVNVFIMKTEGASSMELEENANLLVLSASKTFATRMGSFLEKEGFSQWLCLSTVREAKRLLTEMDADLLILDAPLPSENVVQFAMDLARNKNFDYGIILVSSAALYEEQNLYQTERMGIVTFKKPVDPRMLMQTAKLLLSMRLKIRKLESKADKLRQKLEDEHLVSHAKILLVEHLKMCESDAHRYIEKKAMDACIKKTQVAKEIIALYDKVAR